MRSARLKYFASAWCATLLLAGTVLAQAESNTPLVLPGNQPVRLSVDAPEAPAPHAEAEESLAESADYAQESRPLGSAPAGRETTPAQSQSGASALRSGWNEMLRVGTALVVILGLLFVLRVGLKRLGGPMAGGGRPSGVVEVLARYPVARGQQLVLLKLAARVVLLHQSRGTMTTLTEISDGDEVAGLLAAVESGRRAGQTAFHGLFHRFANSTAAPTQFPPRPTEAERRDGSKVVVDLTRRPPRGKREYRKGRAT